MNNKTKEKILKKCLITGADFSEIFLESTIIKNIKLSNKKIEKISENTIDGIGIRIALNNEKVYGYTNDLTTKNINNIIKKLVINYNSPIKNIDIKLPKITQYKKNIKLNHNEFSDEEKVNLLHKIDNIARNHNEKITQVEVNLIENKQYVEISNSSNTNVSEERTLTRLHIEVYANENGKIESGHRAIGYNLGYEMLDKINLKKEIEDLVDRTIEKLTATSCPGGYMPVVIGPGFGGVIFHEACGHALEATSVAKNVSVFSNKKNKKIASDCITLIDDGTYDSLYGTTIIDDEGNKTKKNILIKNGTLKQYLVDLLNKTKMNQNITGSGRRESYKYLPTSRMNNTYLENKTDKIDEMIKSIKYGLYAKTMGGGSVNPTTGDFNFSVIDAYIIKNGKIGEPVKGASLIGNSKDIMKSISMVSDDLSLESGKCGSASGWVPVTIGQPTIKVDNILVGGSGEQNEL